jgi:uncharacterized membrane protein YhaH (DUF805 family)
MNDVPQDTWFYSREGERLGPVTFSELRAKARNRGLNPRVDMIWTPGMAEWKLSGEVEGLFGRRKAPVQEESLAPRADPYRPPQEESVADQMGRQGGWPGARRRSYIFVLLILPFALSFVVGLTNPILKAEFGLRIASWIVMGATVLPFLIGIYISLQRLVNLGMSRWWYLGNFVPFLNLWVGYRCFACPGGYAFHKKLDGPGIFLAIVYWLLMAVVIVAVAAAVAVMFGAIGTPEMRQQIQDALRAAHAPKP